ncbi:flagellar hook-length control protein FliK [Paenibacillus cremeus]|uniref:Flagellar hook-length control protein FliK n=1 Tax=Paenibacillus cremeus TaxID=2163881 RepID=A0A559KEV8_9BACL|nr:flagellar hook-length control protein FliK [Paenibacillus cremeus]TVY10653.1 flagellar hook-length control protein FliK [Paenibacillus cremeus]
MEIQAQTLIASVSQAGANANAGTDANTAAGQAGFATALNGMMAGGNQDGGKGSNLSGIAALVQLLTPLLNGAPATDVQTIQLTGEQIDALKQLLQQPGKSDALLSNPDLQAWLLQLQALLSTAIPTQPQEQKSDAQSASSTDAAANAANTALNPLLFIPIQSTVQAANSSEQSDQVASVKQPLISQNQAVQLLNQLKDMIQNGSKDPELKQVLKDLPSLLVTAAAQAGEVPKSLATKQRGPQSDLVVQVKSDSNGADAGDLIQVVPTKVQKLEVLAAKNIHTKFNLEQQLSQDDAPLFEPLDQVAATDNGAQPVPIQDFLKQMNTVHTAKTPVLQMPAATFSDDMAHFVVSSFMMESSIEGFTEAKISLYPQHLGQVDVKLTMHNGQLVAQFVADSVAGKEMLESQLSQLKTTLQSQGIQVQKLEVSQSQGFQSGMFQEGRQQQQQSQQSSKQQKSASARIEAMDEISLDELPDKPAANSSAANGSIDVTA